MNRNHGKNTSVRRALAVLVVGLLGLAASPAALAHDRGGPGLPGSQQATSMGFVPFLFKLPPRLVSWSD